jgi:hypothetical protein
MGNWIPDDPTSFVSQLLKISASFMPPPPEGFVSPMTWGVDTHVLERFGRAGVSADRISLDKDTYYLTSPDRSPADVVEAFERFYGPTMNAVEAARARGAAEALHGKLLELARSQNEATDGSTSIPATYLRVTVRL